MAESCWQGEKPRDLKIRNRQVVLDALRRQESVSLGELSARCGLSRNTVKKCVDHFVEMGLVSLTGKGSSTSEGGKKPDLYGFQPQWRVVCGIYHKNGRLIASLYGLDMTLLVQQTVEVPPHIQPQALAGAVAEVVKGLLDRQGFGPERLQGVTLAYHGVVDYYTGTVLSQWGNGWNGDVPLARMISEQLWNRDVSVTNAVRAMMAAEYHQDEAVGENSAVLFTSKGRPMSALIRHGRILQGKRCILGEISGIPLALPAAGMEETDSLQGAGLGVLTSAAYLTELGAQAPELAESSLKAAIQAGTLTLDMLFEEGEKGDPLARLLLRQAARWFAVSIRQFLFLADPNLVLIQGEYARAGAYFLSALRRYVESYVYPAVRVLPEIRLSGIEESLAATLGAACISVSRFFEAEWLYESSQNGEGE